MRSLHNCSHWGDLADGNRCACAADGELSLRTSDNYSNETFLKLIKGFWIEGDAVQPLPPDGLEASALYPEVYVTTLESYYMKLAKTGEACMLSSGFMRANACGVERARLARQCLAGVRPKFEPNEQLEAPDITP